MNETNPELLDLIADRFRILGEPMRLQILHSLRDGERTVNQLVESTGAGQANVSRHLSLLHRHRLVTRRKEGLNAFYRIADPMVFQLCDLVCGSLAHELDAQQRLLQATLTADEESTRGD